MMMMAFQASPAAFSCHPSPLTSWQHARIKINRACVACRFAVVACHCKCLLLRLPRLPRLPPVSVTVLARERLAALTAVTAAVLPIAFRFELPMTLSHASGHGHCALALRTGTGTGTGRVATGCLWQQLAAALCLPCSSITARQCTIRHQLATSQKFRLTQLHWVSKDAGSS